MNAQYSSLAGEGREVAPAVCVIEDDLDLLSAMATALREAGYRVVEASDGAQFLRRFALSESDEPRVDVVVTDNRMPSISGLSVLEKVREQDLADYAILISAYVDDDVYAEASRLGASVLPKPFTLAALLERVHSLVPSH